MTSLPGHSRASSGQSRSVRRRSAPVIPQRTGIGAASLTYYLAMGQSAQALALSETALADHDKALGPNHPWTKDSARVNAQALDALGRGEDAAALRAHYALRTGSDGGAARIFF